MRESLGKIPELPFRARIVFFGEKSEIVSQGEQALEKFARFLLPAEQMQTIGQPKRTGQKNAFAAGQSIDAFLPPGDSADTSHPP